MGLDMNVIVVNADLIGTQQVDLQIPENALTNELQYWRKHHDMHGWMEQLYRKKGGKSEQFNCDTVRLEAEDLDKLERDIKKKDLPATQGFFFGNNPPDSDSDKEDLEFVRKARVALQNKQAVYYTSWW